MEENNNEKRYVEAAEILDKTATFVMNNWDKVILVSNEDTEKGKEIRFYVEKVEKSPLEFLLDDGIEQYVSDEDDNILVTLTEPDDDELLLTVGRTLLDHPRYGKVVWEVVDNITN